MQKKNNTILLIGSGYMAIEYSKVLNNLEVPFVVVGRSEEGVTKFKKETGIVAIAGGIKKWIDNCISIPENAIVAVTGSELGKVTRILINKKIKNILLEKPGGVDDEDILSLNELAIKNNSNVLLAYNRRFFASTIKAEEIIKKDGGVKSFLFEFTEWSHVIKDIKKATGIKENWLLHNSTHVIDMAFFLGGNPEDIKCFKTGNLSWFKKGSIFTGAGVSSRGALFSYHANWESPGRWWIELLTRENRLIFKPLEELKIQKIGSVKVEKVEIDDELDRKFKPGLFLQTSAFLNKDWIKLKTIQEQSEDIAILKKIRG
ncbi:hypothetical protein NEF87_004343 [Candidatus Lokiarchaeum ossiferum]|uniref:Myo-inositol 2-dehydrogenase n=1 Tax=Candidatus Lokiarchaeum ossiferum TaxID=2951803 RepID=A0ABY6HX08_9ARCH|nr:hypothetical protein NEF87_004343 [Candidatus Lokiarchaeum sp. B-35]